MKCYVVYEDSYFGKELYSVWSTEKAAEHEARRLTQKDEEERRYAHPRRRQMIFDVEEVTFNGQDNRD